MPSHLVFKFYFLLLVFIIIEISVFHMHISLEQKLLFKRILLEKVSGLNFFLTLFKACL